MTNTRLPRLGSTATQSNVWGAAFLLVALLLGGCDLAQAQSVSDGEYSVKAAFLYNFAKFVEWPSTAFTDASAPLVIGVLEPDPFGKTLDELEGKSAGSRTIAVHRLKTIKDVGKCHILFVHKALAGESVEVLRALSQAAVLTVSDMDRFAQRGGMIGLSTVANKIRFEINLRKAEEVGLKLSSQLLKLATIVESSP
jgi:hypothetical protein